jgi:two-component sensor histidine kinase
VLTAHDDGRGFQEILFTELHHRFYNSLQLLSATLGMLAAEHRRPEEVRRVQDRIAMLGDLHRTLSRPLANRSELHATLVDVCMNLASGFGRGSVTLDIDRSAFPDDPMAIRGLTLILVELVTNALKHGDCENGMIRVLVSGTKDCCRLSVTNSSGSRTAPETRSPHVAARFAEAMGGTLTVTVGAEHEVFVTVPHAVRGSRNAGESHDLDTD